MSMWKVIKGYLARLPGATKRVTDTGGTERDEFAYARHSLRPTTARSSSTPASTSPKFRSSSGTGT
ncbi:MAG: hypothetical protein ACE5G2_13130 [Candidatus Krumholzibacteriia bacterium]